MKHVTWNKKQCVNRRLKVGERVKIASKYVEATEPSILDLHVTPATLAEIKAQPGDIVTFSASDGSPAKAHIGGGMMAPIPTTQRFRVVVDEEHAQ